QRAAGCGERLVTGDSACAGLLDEQGCEARRPGGAVGGGGGRVARRSRPRPPPPRAPARPRAEPMHEPVTLRLGGSERRQEPRRALEELCARVLRAPRLRSTDGVTADEAARAERGGADGNLRRADVGDRAAFGARLERGPDLAG